MDNPALVAYKDKLLLVYRGHNNEDLWYDTYDGIDGWKGDRKIENACSKYGSGLAVFDEKVFMVHRGKDNDKLLTIMVGVGLQIPRPMIIMIYGLVHPHPSPAIKIPNALMLTNVLEDGTKLPTTYVSRLICVHRGWG